MNASPNRVALIIPALNEEDALAHVLQAVPSDWVDHIIVVDNGSTDQTASVATRNGAHVIREEQRGYGAAVQAGLNRLSQRWPSTDIVVFLDGDYSDDPAELPGLLQPLIEGDADFVLGSRRLGTREPGSMLLRSIWGNRMACWLIRQLWHVRYTDLGPFRAIRFDALKRLNMIDRSFGWTVEMQIKAAKAGLRVKEIPVSYRKRIGQSKISGTLHGSVCAAWKILFTIFQFGFLQRNAGSRRNGHRQPP